MTATVPAGPASIAAPAAIARFRRPLRPLAFASELWTARQLIRTLAERDLKSRYKQAILGLAWAVINPILLTIVFTLVFTRVAKIDTHGVPYALFSYTGLVTWGFLSTSASQGATSLVSNMSLLLLPVQLAFATGVALLLSSLVVYLRDLRHALPIILQLGLFGTPVAYSLSFVPSAWRLPYVIVNPLGGVIDGYRRALLEGHLPQLGLSLAALAGSLLWLALGYLVFKRLETGIADVA